MAEECKSAGRSLPVGAVVGLVTLLIGATLTWFVCSTLVEAKQLGQSIYPLFDAAKITGNRLVISSLFIGTLLACLASANGCIADTSRALFSMSRDTLMPEAFSAVHPEYKTPYRAILFLMPISLAFAYTGLLDQVITFSILSALLVYLLTAIMMFKFRAMYPLGSIKRWYIAPWHPAPAIVLFLIASMTLVGMYFGYWVDLVAGFIFYILASVWFIKMRYKSIDFKKFIDITHWPRPRNI